MEAVVIAVLAGALVAAHSSPAPPFAASVVPPSGSFTRQMGRVVYRARFRPHNGWFTGRVNSNTTANISSAGYVVSGSSMVHHVLTVPYGVAHRAISVDAVATNYVGSDVSVGAGCQSASGISPPLAYQIVVYPSGQWYLEQARIGGTVHTLTSGLSSPLGPTASLQVTCAITSVASGWETTQLVGYVNGARVGSIGDKVDDPGVGGYLPVLLLGTFGPKGSATFTSVTERSFGPPPASAD